MNQIKVEGFLLKEPIIKYDGNNKPYTDIILAVPKKDNVQTDYDFISCHVNGAKAEFLKRNCRRSELVGVMGTIDSITPNSTKSYNNKIKISVSNLRYESYRGMTEKEFKIRQREFDKKMKKIIEKQKQI